MEGALDREHFEYEDLFFRDQHAIIPRLNRSISRVSFFFAYHVHEFRKTGDEHRFSVAIFLFIISYIHRLILILILGYNP